MFSRFFGGCRCCIIDDADDEDAKDAEDAAAVMVFLFFLLVKFVVVVLNANTNIPKKSWSRHRATIITEAK